MNEQTNQSTVNLADAVPSTTTSNTITTAGTVVTTNGTDETKKDSNANGANTATTTTSNLSILTKILPPIEVEWWKRGCGRCTNCSRTACCKCNLCKVGVPTLTSVEELDKWRPYQCYQKVRDFYSTCVKEFVIREHVNDSFLESSLHFFSCHSVLSIIS